MTSKVHQVPCPSCGNWTAPLAKCQDCGKPLPAPTRKQLRDASTRSDTNLAAIRAEQQRKAEEARAVFSDEWLAKAYEGQVAVVQQRIDRLNAACEKNWAVLDERDPRWKAWYLLVARLSYVHTTLRLLKERKHIVVCGNHGVDGMTGMATPAETAEQMAADFEGLSLLGLTTGEGAVAYERFCESCASPQLEQHAQRLLAAHRGEMPLSTALEPAGGTKHA